MDMSDRYTRVSIRICGYDEGGYDAVIMGCQGVVCSCGSSSYGDPDEDEPEEDGLIGRLVSMPEHFGHREGLRRIGFLAEGVIW